jgi:hypothetical protein
MNGWKFWKVLKMSLHDYLELFRQAIEKVEDYGYAEAIEINEEIRPNKQAVIKAKIVFIDGSALHIKEYIEAILPDVSDIMDEVLGFL